VRRRYLHRQFILAISLELYGTAICSSVLFAKLGAVGLGIGTLGTCGVLGCTVALWRIAAHSG
jgi:uncharacterized membrane protein